MVICCVSKKNFLKLENIFFSAVEKILFKQKRDMDFKVVAKCCLLLTLFVHTRCNTITVFMEMCLGFDPFIEFYCTANPDLDILDTCDCLNKTR